MNLIYKHDNNIVDCLNDKNEIIFKLKIFIDELDKFTDNYYIEKNNIVDIYEILQSENMKYIFDDENYEQLYNLIDYHKKIYNEIISSITYEDICKIIEKYLMISSEDNEKSLYDLTQNLLKININQIKKVIYKTSPRLLTKPEQVLIDMMFEKEVSNNYLIKTIKWLKNNK